MAKKITVELVDDYDGESTATETVNFAVDGVAYEIDLSDKNAAALRGDLADWVDKARRVGGRRVAHRPPPKGAVQDPDAIREWAKSTGRKVALRGRISRDVADAYEARDKEPAAPQGQPQPTKAAGGSRVEDALAKARSKKQQPAKETPGEQPTFSSASSV